MDYYFGDQLRWTYGFDNPNKAAALIAAMLPLLWLLVAGAFRIRRFCVKWILMAAGVSVFCGGWWLLFKTYSRGGIIAAMAGCLFAVIMPFFNNRRLPARLRLPGMRTQLLVALALAAIIATLAFSTRAAERSVGWLGEHEGSVDNRLSLWKGGLRMIAENPWGVGAGKSGETYMQWYEPLDLTAGYRTMVNSFLTYVVELGLPVFGATMLLAVMLWTFTGPGRRHETMPAMAGALRGSIIAFVVAGMFSTTMEDPWVWIPSSASLLLLLGLRLKQAVLATRLPPPPGRAAPAATQGAGGAFLALAKSRLAAATLVGATTSAILSGGLYGAGKLLDRNEPLTVRISAGGAEVRVTVRENGRTRQLEVYPDQAVLGSDYGKLLRTLALGAHINIRLASAAEPVPSGATAMLAGSTAGGVSVGKGARLILLAPDRMAEARAQALLRDAESVGLLLPSYDEDGRVAFWENIAARAGATRLHKRTLDGVGTEVDWAWDSVIQECAAFNQASDKPPLSRADALPGDPRLPQALSPTTKPSPQGAACKFISIMTM